MLAVETGTAVMADAVGAGSCTDPLVDGNTLLVPEAAAPVCATVGGGDATALLTTGAGPDALPAGGGGVLIDTTGAVLPPALPPALGAAALGSALVGAFWFAENTPCATGVPLPLPVLALEHPPATTTKAN